MIIAITYSERQLLAMGEGDYISSDMDWDKNES